MKKYPIAEIDLLYFMKIYKRENILFLSHIIVKNRIIKNNQLKFYLV